MTKQLETEDLVNAGFHRLDRDFSKKPPKISWGGLYTRSDKLEKVAYLEKLAASMNHAAFIIQGERDKLGKLVEMKERQIVQAKKALDDLNAMVQSEVTRMNADRQLYNAEIAKLRARVRELENGDND